MRRLLAASCLSMIPALPAAAQGWRQPLAVAPNSSLSILVDGAIGAAEWQDAQRISGSEPCDILLKRFDGYLFVGLKCPGLELPVLDLYLMPEGQDVYQLHVSAYLAERVLNEDNADSLWQPGVRLDWNANTIEWNTAVRDSLVAAGIYGQEMLRRAVLPFDGFEVRIGERQFNSTQWRMRVQVSRFVGDGAPFVFPPDNGMGATTKNWLLLDLSAPEIISGRGM